MAGFAVQHFARAPLALVSPNALGAEAESLCLALINFWFCDKLHAPYELGSVFGRQWRKQRFLQLRSTDNDPKQRILADGSQRYLGRTSITAIAAPCNKGSLLHPTYHFAERAAVDPDMPCKVRQRERAPLVKGQEYAELAWCYFTLGGQVLIKDLEARIEQSHEEAKPLVQFERAGNVFGRSVFRSGPNFVLGHPDLDLMHRR
jgi:hypothetical protein